MRRALLITLAAAAAACGRDQPAGEPAEDPAAAPAAVDTLARIRAETEEVRAMLARRSHFAFDRSAIRSGDDTRILEEKAAILRANPNLRIEITGHCDERGTRPYNQALGLRRAEAAKRFLVQRGISADRITVRSRGEDEPLEAGRNAQAWARNRRAEFAITAGGDRLRRPTP